MSFSKSLQNWYLINKRDLDWRKTINPYYIWLSEIILQQTRVEQGAAYYEKFITNYPTIFDLASASEEEVLKLWQGLGYYSRARNIHYSAKYVVNDLEGNFPTTYKEIIKLKGVGDYTASAIASFCFKENTAVVDGNVYRVLSRYFGVAIPINTTEGIKYFKQLAQELIDTRHPDIHNQAIMEFGALQCKPQNPKCEICPLGSSCESLKEKRVNELPVKLKKLKVRQRFFNYITVLTKDNKTILRQRIGKGIWQQLYEFPLIESSKRIDEQELADNPDFKNLFEDLQFTLKRFNHKQLVHKLSHQHLNVTFWILSVSQFEKATIQWSDIEKYPVPILIHNFIETLNHSDNFSIFDSN